MCMMCYFKMLTKLVFVVCILFLNPVESTYSLRQVVILSRHNVRTPLSKNLNELSPKPWPSWKVKSGYLTAKGAHLEGLMGRYFSAWLQKEGLLESSCPTEDLFYAYANAKQRTKASAMSFVDKAFPNCNIKVHFKGESDPVFNPVIHNATAHFRNVAFKEMEARLKDLKLNNSLVFIENILDYRDSEQCKVKKECDLCADDNSIDLNVGNKPNILGPLKVAKSVIDSFVMSYYEGFPMKDVAWDLINDDSQWQLIMAISRGYHDVIFNTTLVAKDIASPLLKYISDVFMNKKENAKVTLVMGHDANILTVLNSMNFKVFNLHDQFEKSPVGGKLVFQKWYNTDSEKNFLKVNYVYQSTEQLRDGLDLTLESPPQFIQLELNNCKVNKSGFCPWDDFIMFLKTLL